MFLNVLCCIQDSACLYSQCPKSCFSRSPQVLGFATPADVDTWLLANPYKTTGAVHFSFTPEGALGYGLQTNSTVKNQRGIYEDITFDYQTPLQASAEREIARYLAQGETVGGWEEKEGKCAREGTGNDYIKCR